ncbi:MAG: transposase [candidate division Zixibacteria bacterium]|nr:transposase [candidate division Zixibacteria bacterium]
MKTLCSTRPRPQLPQTDGICRRYNKTVPDEFYKPIFRKRIFGAVEESQVELDGWMNSYNRERPHWGIRCQGRTLLETIVDGIDRARKANLENEVKEKLTA